MQIIPKLNGNRCLCRACGAYFSTVANFERHRRSGACINPESVGLVQDRLGVWKGAPTRDAEGLVRRYQVTEQHHRNGEARAHLAEGNPCV